LPFARELLTPPAPSRLTVEGPPIEVGRALKQTKFGILTTLPFTGENL